MYQTFVTKNGAVAVRDTVKMVAVTKGPDGVEEIVPPDHGFLPDSLIIPPRLLEWLIDVRLLRHVPISYMVPDVALLPAEAIRFFNVDLTWIDRVIDGALAAGNVGTVDATFGYALLLRIREELDAALKALAGNGWDPKTDPMTGMLMRSDAARRWPNMIVRAFSNTTATAAIPVLRAEAISQNLYIALFAGRPVRVELREPFVGARFGVESQGLNPGPPYVVNKRGPNGKGITGAPLKITMDTNRVIDVNQIKTDMQSTWATAKAGDFAGRGTALQLEQLPYQQVFQNSVEEKEGVEPRFVPQKRGVLNMKKLTARAQAMAKLEA